MLVAGDGADDVARQADGWMLSWQGIGTIAADLPNATSIWHGIVAQVRLGRGPATLATDGRYTTQPQPDLRGDHADLAFDDLAGTLATMQCLRAAGIAVVTVFLFGRPLWVNLSSNAIDAFMPA